MATDVYRASNLIGRVSTSGEVYYGGHKVGWVNGNGDIYQDGVRVGWVTHAGHVFDSRLNEVGCVTREGDVYTGDTLIGRVDCAANRYCTGGAALLLLLGKFAAHPSGMARRVETHINTGNRPYHPPG